MRQCGYLAAAASYALDHHVERLKDDHHRAKKCGDALKQQSWVKEVNPVFTNIVIFKVADDLTSSHVCDKLAKHNILCAPVNERTVRWVFHLDIDDQMTDYVVKVSENLF